LIVRVRTRTNSFYQNNKPKVIKLNFEEISLSRVQLSVGSLLLNDILNIESVDESAKFEKKEGEIIKWSN
jgi:hypothetical protein